MLNYRRRLSSLLVLCCAAQLVAAKQNLQDWNNVRILEPGDPVVVKTQAGEKYEGEFKDATVNSLEVVVNIPQVMRRVITLRKDEVLEVRKKLSRAASTAIGGGIGLGVGVGLGAIADAKDKYGEDPGLMKGVLGFTGLMFGMGIGMRHGLFSKRIYYAP